MRKLLPVAITLLVANSAQAGPLGTLKKGLHKIRQAQVKACHRLTAAYEPIPGETDQDVENRHLRNQVNMNTAILMSR